MANPQQFIDIPFIWWNVESFAHYDPNRAAQVQWPTSAEAYAAKCSRVDAVFKHITEAVVPPSIIAIAEVTSKSAEALRDRRFKGYQLLSLEKELPDSLQVAVIYRQDLKIEIQLPFKPPHTTRGTRPMAVLDLLDDHHRLHHRMPLDC